MNKYTQLEALIFSFCDRHQISMIQPDEHLNYVLLIEDIEIKCLVRGSSIFIDGKSTRFDNEKLENNPDAFKVIMQQSLIESYDSRCIISLDTENTILFSLKLDEHQCGSAEFEEAIESLVNHADTVLQVLAQTQDRSFV